MYLPATDFEAEIYFQEVDVNFFILVWISHFQLETLYKIDPKMNV